MNELFQIPETKSPRLKWIEKHGIEIAENAMDEWEGKRRNFMAYVPFFAQGYGDTLDEALSAVADALHVKLWNQP